jgi:DNA-directed RNA polymerase subunit M/transcription elongation factor TFIIS
MNDEIKTLISKMKDSKWIYQQALEDLETMTSDEYIETRLKLGKVGWNHPMFSDHRRKQQEQDDYIISPFEVEEGVITCIACRSKRVFSTTMQTRAADEPMTTIAQCTKCKTKWTQNG